MSTNPRHTRPELTRTDKVLDYFAEHTRGQTVHCLQVGANDGKTNDPIHTHILNHRWQSILVEPDPHVFEHELKRTYAGCAHVRLENVALAPVRENRPFYRLAFTRARWATGLSGFDRTRLDQAIRDGYVARMAREHGVALPERDTEYIEEIPVQTDTFDGLLERHRFDTVDVLCIDTEGYDYEVLKLFDFTRYRPGLILYESKYLSEAEFLASQYLLKSHGYRLFWQKGDTLAITFPLPPALRWRFRIQAWISKI